MKKILCFFLVLLLLCPNLCALQGEMAGRMQGQSLGKLNNIWFGANIDSYEATTIWSNVYTNNDGSYILIQLCSEGTDPSPVYLSKNYGNTFTKVEPAGAGYDANNAAVAIDSDGSVIFCSARVSESVAGFSYVSTDYGSTWTTVWPKGSPNKIYPCSACCDSDGSVIIVSAYNGRIWKSANTGSTWTEIRPFGNQNMSGVGGLVCSSDGSKIAVLDTTDTGVLQFSSNGGTNWTDITPDPAGVWTGPYMSADGSVIAVTDWGSNIYISKDSGATWKAYTPYGVNAYFSYISGNSDGSKLIVSEDGIGLVLTSNDYGVNWEEKDPINMTWYTTCAMSGDGHIMVVGEDGSETIFIGRE